MSIPRFALGLRALVAGTDALPRGACNLPLTPGIAPLAIEIAAVALRVTPSHAPQISHPEPRRGPDP